MPTERGAALADQFAEVNADVIACAGSCSEAEWRTMVPGEEWTVGVVLHHIAESHASALQWLLAMARGDAVIDSLDDIHHRNLDHAARAAEVGPEETIALLTSNGAAIEAALRRLTDDELDGTAPFGPADGRTLPVEQMAAVTIRHPRDHLAHAREALAARS